MSASIDRLQELRRYMNREWHDVNNLDKRRYRIVEWLVTRGWLERHPTSFLSQVRITEEGYEVVAQAGGDVSGNGW